MHTSIPGRAVRGLSLLLALLLASGCLVLTACRTAPGDSASGDSAVSYTLRLWTAGSDYWDVYYDVLEAVGREFRESNIEMAYPHINIHMDS